jgi:hypothetical protein
VLPGNGAELVGGDAASVDEDLGVREDFEEQVD